MGLQRPHDLILLQGPLRIVALLRDRPGPVSRPKAPEAVEAENRAEAVELLEVAAAAVAVVPNALAARP